MSVGEQRTTNSSRDVEAQTLLGRSGDHTNGETNKERQEQIRHLEKEAFQLANCYFVFQGVIFTAFYNAPSHLKCQYHWIPFALSFLAGFLNLCALLRIMLNYKKTLDDIDKHATTGARGNHAPPPASAASGSTRSSDGDDHEPIAVACARHWRLVYAIVCMSIVIAFFVITLIGCWTITCGGNSLPAAPPSPAAT